MYVLIGSYCFATCVPITNYASVTKLEAPDGLGPAWQPRTRLTRLTRSCAATTYNIHCV